MPAWRPNPGPQERFLECGSFEALYGGAAGGGKSEALIVSPTRYVDLPDFHGILFRRTYNELKRHLIPECQRFYRHLGGLWRATERTWRFPSGARIELGSMDHVDERHKYDSAEYQWVGFDELTTFEELQYTYMISRMRSTSGIPIRLRGATNPGGPGHEWVLDRFSPWLYQPGAFDDEYDGPYCSPEERAYFLRDEDGDRMVARGTQGALSRSFFPATVDDNPHIGEDYKDRLAALDPLTHLQKRYGDWMARPAPGIFFRRDMFGIVDAAPTDSIFRCRYWDFAATEAPDEKKLMDAVAASKGPDYTAGVLVSVRRNLSFVVEDVARARVGPDEVEDYVVSTAALDASTYGSKKVLQAYEHEPGSAGKIFARSVAKSLRGHWFKAVRPTGNKIERAKPASAQCNARNVSLVKGTWNAVFIAEGERFPMGKKDQIDGFSGAMAECSAATPKKTASGGRRSMHREAMGGF